MSNTASDPSLFGQSASKKRKRLTITVERRFTGQLTPTQAFINVMLHDAQCAQQNNALPFPQDEGKIPLSNNPKLEPVVSKEKEV
jgi:hypothetical protein